MLLLYHFFQGFLQTTIVFYSLQNDHGESNHLGQKPMLHESPNFALFNPTQLTSLERNNGISDGASNKILQPNEILGFGWFDYLEYGWPQYVRQDRSQDPLKSINTKHKRH